MNGSTENPKEYVEEQATHLLRGVIDRVGGAQTIDVDTLAGAEALIAEMIRRRRVAGLVIALAIVHIRNARLYPQDLTWSEYRRTCRDRIGITYQDVWRYERIAEAYVTYYHDLENIGFDLHGGSTTKLMLLPEATAKYGRIKAVAEFARLGVREYAAWVKERPASIPYKGRGTDFGVTAMGLTYQRQLVISWEDITAIADAGKLDRLQAAIKSIRRERNYH